MVSNENLVSGTLSISLSQQDCLYRGEALSDPLTFYNLEIKLEYISSKMTKYQKKIARFNSFF